MKNYNELDLANLTEEQRVVHAAIVGGPRGVLAGPLKVWLHSPQLAQTAQALGAFCRYGTSLEPRLSELAIVTVGAHWTAGFEWATHAPLAQRAGISAEVLAAIRSGGRPNFNRADEQSVFDFSTALLRTHQVPTEIFERVEQEIGAVGVVELTGILGYYTLISMTIRAFRVPLPAGEADPFDEVRST